MILTARVCSIVIRTYNEVRYLESGLSAVAAQTWPAERREVIVVDSGSDDGTLEVAARHGCRIVGIRREDFSFGRSLNLGCDVARGDFLVFVSGHCVPCNPRWLEELVQPFADEKVAVTYGRQVGGPETKFSEHVLFEKYFPAHRSSGQAPFFCNNANAAFRRSAWAMHRFDESLTGLEDMRLARVLVESGRHVRYAPRAAVFHYHHETWAQVLRRYEREAIALHRIMPEVHVHWHDAVRYFAAGVLGDMALALSKRQLFHKLPEIVAFRACQYYGAWRGNHAHRELSRREKERYFFPK
ncbi:MAG TPA: glycosyltransferase [Chthoniobacterales bacterium]